VSEAHGEHFIRVDENIIYVTLIGSFNDIGAENVTRAMKATINRFNGTAFSILVNDLKVSGATPEAYAVVENYNQWLNGQNMTAKAVVISSSVTLAIIEKYAPSRQQQNIATFDNEPDAIAWLKSQ